MRVPVHPLKAGLSRYLAQVRAGEVIAITSHDKPVARLVGMPQGAPASVGQMIARGVATWSGRKLELAPPVRQCACRPAGWP